MTANKEDNIRTDESYSTYSIPIELINKFVSDSCQFNKIQILQKALNYHSNQNLIKAEEYYRLFIELGYEDHRVFSNYGVICKNSDRKKQAINLFKRSIDIYPEKPEAYVNMSIILCEENRFNEAIRLLHRAISIRKNYTLALSTLGMALRNVGEHKESIDILLLAISLSPEYIKLRKLAQQSVIQEPLFEGDKMFYIKIAGNTWKVCDRQTFQIQINLD